MVKLQSQKKTVKMNLSTDPSHKKGAQSAQKFLFNLSFDEELEGQEKEPTFTQEQLDAAKKEAYEAGQLDGRNAMLDSLQQQANVMLDSVEKKLQEVMVSSYQTWIEQLDQFHKLAYILIRKIMPHYEETYGAQEIIAIVEKVMEDLVKEPRLVIRVNSEVLGDLKEKFDEIAHQQAFEGKVIVMDDATLARTDCRIEWAEGGLEMSHKKIWQKIEQVMNISALEISEEEALSALETDEIVATDQEDLNKKDSENSEDKIGETP